MPELAMPVPLDTRLHGTAGTVALAVVAVAQCPGGHRFLETVGDVGDIEEVAARQARWAEEHAASCTGADVEQPAAA